MSFFGEIYSSVLISNHFEQTTILYSCILTVAQERTNILKAAANEQKCIKVKCQIFLGIH